MTGAPCMSMDLQHATHHAEPLCILVVRAPCLRSRLSACACMIDITFKQAAGVHSQLVPMQPTSLSCTCHCMHSAHCCVNITVSSSPLQASFQTYVALQTVADIVSGLKGFVQCLTTPRPTSKGSQLDPMKPVGTVPKCPEVLDCSGCLLWVPMRHEAVW